MIIAPSNVIPFPTRIAEHREEIRFLNNWRQQIYSAYPTMTALGQSMADIYLDRIAVDLRSLGVANYHTEPPVSTLSI